MLASPRLVARDLRYFFRLSRCGLLVFALFAAEKSAQATPTALFGTGPRSTALAGGGTSLPLGPEATLVNPAELAESTRGVLRLGIVASDFSLSYDTSAGSTAFPAELSKALTLGVVAPLVPQRPQGVRAALGLFAQTPPDYLVRAHAPFPEEVSFPLLVDRAGALDLGVGLGFGYDRVSLGFGLEVLAALKGKQVVGVTAAAPAGVGTELFPAWAPAVGLGVDLGTAGQLGIAFRSVLRADFNVDVPAPNLSGLEIAPLSIQGVAHYEPLKLDAEYSRAFGGVRLLVGARYEHWSAFPGVVGPTVECPPGVACGTAAPPDAGYSDAVVPRLGLESSIDAAPAEVTLRAGYAFVPTPVPEQTGASNTFDAAHHGIGLGYRVGFARETLPLEFEGALRLDLLAPRTHEKRASAAEGPLGPVVTTHGHVVTWVFAVGVEL